MPVVGFLDSRSPDALVDRLRGFRQGLKDTGYVEGDNVTITYRWAENHFDRLPELAAELVRRRVAVIAVTGPPVVAFAAKAATATIPIVFTAAEDPVRLGLVASLARPGGNLTGVNFLGGELVAKQLELLRELVPIAARVAVLINPASAATTDATLRDAEPAARTLGLQIQILRVPALARKSILRLQHLRGDLTPCLSAWTPSSVGVSNWSNWRPTIESPQCIWDVNSPKSAG